MSSPVLVEISPNKSNIYLARGKFTSVVESLSSLAEALKVNRLSHRKTIVFCQKRDMCSRIYSFFTYYLGPHFTEPPGSDIRIPENRLADMYTSGTQDEVKSNIVSTFSKEDSKLRIVVATIAFGMGVDCPNVRLIVHIGPPNDIESYIQETGRAGRDNLPSCALLLHGKGLRLYSHCSSGIMTYTTHGSCLRDFIYGDFDSYLPGTVHGCKCCENCQKSCVCGKCSPMAENVDFNHYVKNYESKIHHFIN